MTQSEILTQHQQVCDEIHQLALEENRFLKQNQRVPDSSFMERKKGLLARLDQTLSELKAASADTNPVNRPDPEAVEKARARIMQILHLDRENEQLLFRYSLGAGPRPTAAKPPPSQLQRIYHKHG
ncbi:MAG TPA: hypothetical protein PLV33_08510 [Opitutaceae bacterium]|jgi:triphosphoribosyl-dephospho-CoA synthetase|nr:hypothetical protein [Opitutaceae bacterium]HOR25382.1 hypothetical protein [Opitutaceae bacterium]HPK50157.1 hypothetical protein [Opitutaceae bacterium]